MKNTFKNKNTYFLTALPIIFLVTVFLFAIRGNVVKTGLENFFWYTGNGYDGDIFAYFRMKLFIILIIISTLYLLLSVFSGTGKIYKHKVYIPMIIFSIMVLVSYFAAEYKVVAFIGFLERYEGTFVLIGYMLIMFYAMNMLNDERAFKIIFYCFSAACAILGIWGVLQVMGIDINNLPAWLYIPSSLRSSVDLSAKMGADAVRWFFSNQNYSSFFMVFPICISAMLIIVNGKIMWKIIFTALLALMFYSLWNAASLGGMVGLAASGVIGIIVFNKKLIEWKQSIMFMLVAFAVSAVVSMPKIMEELNSVASVYPLTVYADDSEAEGLKYVDIDYIKTDGANIIFNFSGTELTIETENNDIKAIYENGVEIGNKTDYIEVNSSFMEDTGYSGIIVKTAKKTWEFGIVEGEVYYVSPSGMGIKLDKVESFGFKNSQDFATYRGYIWSRTIPLLKDTIFIGHGADTFALYFPQYDYAGRYNIGYYTDTSRIMVDKPHNMYLGMAVNTGIVSLIALICIFAMYIYESFKIYRKCEYTSFADFMGAGIFVAVFGFLVSGIVNDSTVQVMPVFYALLGTGFALNRLSQNK